MYSDVADFTERLKLMSFKGSLKDNALLNLASLTKAALEAAAYPLNNNQLGVTLYAVNTLLKEKHRRQIIQVPAGHGKSRCIAGIMAALVYSSIQYKNTDDYEFKIVFTNQVLLDNDKEKLSVVAKALNAKVDFVAVGVGMQLENDYKKNLVTIIDEVDCAIIDHDLKLFAFDDNKNRSIIIGLTATAAPLLSALEVQILRKFYGFVIADSCIDKNNELVDVDDEISLAGFMMGASDEINKFARLVYCRAD